MDRRAICMIIWLALIMLGAGLARIIPADWLYGLGFLIGSITLPFCHIALFDRKDRH